MISVRSDALRTSVINNRIADQFLRTQECGYVGEANVERIFMIPREIRPISVFLKHSRRSGRRDSFSANIVVNLPCLVTMFVETEKAGSYAVFDESQDEVFQNVFTIQPIAQGPPPTSWTLEPLEVASTVESGIRASLEEMHSLVLAITQGASLPTTAEFDSMLTKASQHHGTPENIEEWARQLAEDVSRLDD